MLTHPVNNFWLANFELKGAGARFFGFGSGGKGRAGNADWTQLRDRWEHSHVVRAVFAMLSLILLAIAVAL